MKRFALLLSFVVPLTSCAFFKAVFSPGEIATIDQCADAQLQPTISALFTQALALAMTPPTSATAAALDALAASIPEGEAAIGCILKSIATAGRQALDGGTIASVITGATAVRAATVLDPVSQSNVDGNLEAFETRHKRLSVLPVLPVPDAGK